MLQEFVQAVNKAIDKKLSDVHTAIPGKIVSFDADTGLAVVQPVLEYVLPTGKRLSFPQISGVPVLIPQSSNQNMTIAFPIKKDDGCLILIAEQSLDYWMYGHKTDTDLKFDLTNAVCIPGLFPRKNDTLKTACNNNSLILKNGYASIELKNGNVNITGDLYVSGSVHSND